MGIILASTSPRRRELMERMARLLNDAAREDNP